VKKLVKLAAVTILALTKTLQTFYTMKTIYKIVIADLVLKKNLLNMKPSNSSNFQLAIRIQV